MITAILSFWMLESIPAKFANTSATRDVVHKCQILVHLQYILINLTLIRDFQSSEIRLDRNEIENLLVFSSVLTDFSGTKSGKRMALKMG